MKSCPLVTFVAQHDPSFQQGALWVHIGSIMAFVGLLGVGIAIMVSKPKAGQKSLSPAATRAVGAAVVLLAFVVGYFMW